MPTQLDTKVTHEMVDAVDRALAREDRDLAADVLARVIGAALSWQVVKALREPMHVARSRRNYAT